MLATTVGGLVGALVGWLVGWSVGEAVAVVAGVVVGWAAVGTAQWIVLRKRVYRSGWWVLATAVGGLVGGLVVAGLAVGWLVGLVVGLVVSWAVVGTAQWIVLRKRVHRSGWWMLVTAVGGPVGLVVGVSLGVGVGVGVGVSLVVDAVVGLPTGVMGFGFAFLGLAVVMVGLTSGVLVLVVGGAITGFAMIMLLRHPIPKVRDPRQEERSEQGGTVGLSDSTEGVEQQPR